MPVTLGSVLERAFRTFFRNFVPFVLLAALVYSPVLIWTAVFLTGRITQETLTTYSIVTGVGGMLLSLLATAAITYGVFADLRGEPASMGRCLSVGLSRLLPVIGVTILVAIAVALGVLALIVPGVILLCMLWLAVPVTVVEQCGVVDAMKRSRELTNGYKMMIFGVLFVVGLIEGVVQVVLEQVFLSQGNISVSSVRLFLGVATGLAVLFVALRSVANAVAYHDIRIAKEDVEVDELIAVFE